MHESTPVLLFGIVILLLTITVIVQCILISQMDNGHSSRIVEERRQALKAEALREQREHAEGQPTRTGDSDSL